LRRLLVRAVSITLVASASGCTDSIRGPEPMPVASVRGVVTEGGRPVGGGWIEFVPVEGTIGNLRTARLRADGSFSTDGVPVGVNLVRVVHARVENPAIAQFFSASFSPIRRVVPAREGSPLAIELLEECVRYESLYARIRARQRHAREGVP
jgi:hypothetical protein